MRTTAVIHVGVLDAANYVTEEDPRGAAYVVIGDGPCRTVVHVEDATDAQRLGEAFTALAQQMRQRAFAPEPAGVR